MSTSPVKVLFVNHTSCVGGAEHSLVELIQGIDRSRFTPAAVVPGPGELADALQGADVEVRFAAVSMMKRPSGAIDMVSTLRRVKRVIPELQSCIEQSGAAIIHANSTTAQIYAGPAAARARVSSVWHCRDLVNIGVAGYWLARRRPHVICVSRAVARNLPRSIRGRSSVHIVLNGISTQRFEACGRRESVRAELGLGGGDQVVTMIAPLVPWKAHMRFLEMAAQVADAVPDTRFLIVGDDHFGHHPAYEGKLRETVRGMRIAGKVHFTGHRDDVAAILEASDIFVHPARREPFGRVVVEAMAMALPVVAVDDAGPSEIVRHDTDGLLTDGSVAGLSAAVIRLLQDPKTAARLGAAACDRARADFDVRRTANEVQQIYERLAGTRD
jgi:glycosyltransferase involved in cell wall biosynthesis